MDAATTLARWNQDDLEARVVRYGDLVPCLNAFIDTRTPGSESKENFTIIGPGVSENPDQHIHIAEPHGFNIGAARQPPGCVNSQHSHETAEIFVVHSGRWSFDFGENADDASVEVGPGDVVSLPTRTFRGFRNIGDDTGFLFCVLGGDDPGNVTWAPRVFEMAKDYGLVLLENGALVDTAAGQAMPEGVAPMAPTDRAMVAQLRVMSRDDADRVRAPAPDTPTPGETLVIGEGGELPPVDEFTLSRLVLAGGDTIDYGAAAVPEVAFVQSGTARVGTPDAQVTLNAGDTMTLPVGLDRSYASQDGATLILVRGR